MRGSWLSFNSYILLIITRKKVPQPLSCGFFFNRIFQSSQLERKRRHWGWVGYVALGYLYFIKTAWVFKVDIYIFCYGILYIAPEFCYWAGPVDVWKIMYIKSNLYIKSFAYDCFVLFTLSFNVIINRLLKSVSTVNKVVFMFSGFLKCFKNGMKDPAMI